MQLDGPYRRRSQNAFLLRHPFVQQWGFELSVGSCVLLGILWYWVR